MGWFVAVLWYIGASIAHGALRRYLTGKADTPDPLRPETFEPEHFPIATEASPVPVVYGTVRLDSVNVLWYGAPATRPVDYGGTTVGHRYYVTLHYGLCLGPIDYVVRVEWDDLQPEMHGVIYGAVYDRFFYRQPLLFGGDFEAGGIYTEIRAYKGTSTQPPDSHLEAKVGTDLPGHPNLAYLVVRGNPYPHSTADPCIRMELEPGWQCPCTDYLYEPTLCIAERGAYIGTSPQLHPMAVEVRRVAQCNALGIQGYDINGDANPANMIYEILRGIRDTSGELLWGLGISNAYIDVDSFEEAGGTLAAEDLGLSMKVDGDANARAVIEDILRHIDGVLILDHRTGLLGLRLIRNDYVVGELQEFGPDEIRTLSFTRPALESLSNVVRVTYMDRSERYKTRVVTAQDLAAVQQRGEQIVVETSYSGVTNSALAQKLAARDLKVVSYPWARINMTVDRTAWKLRQGSVFKLNWPDLGISGLACRVNRIAPGDLTKGEIEIDASEDVFGVSWTAYGPIPPSGWEDPFQSQ